MFNIISLGAGVQSSTMALMAAHGEITPMPDAAIFADTQAEPKAVYEWLDWLEKQLPFPVYRVTAGNLRDALLAGMAGTGARNARPPFFTAGGGMLRRQCTRDFKINPIHKKIRELIGLKFRQRAPKVMTVSQWIGISKDEASRMKDSRKSYIVNRWPLIELGMTRLDCLRWMQDHGYPKPIKSACTFCPYHDDRSWRDMDKESFADAVAVDAAIRQGMPGPKRPKNEQWFVHRSLVPLDQVDFSTDEDRGQLNMFENECEGMCGV